VPNYFPFDLQFALYLQQIQISWFSALMKAISFLGEPKQALVLIIGISGAFWYLHNKKSGIFIAISSFGAIIIGEIVKFIVKRPRPDPNLIHQYLPELKPDSFPSGHVLIFLGLFGFIFYLVQKEMKGGLSKKITQAFLILLILLMSISRIYLGEHWLSDVIGSLVIGGVWLYVIAKRFQLWNH